ncbi:DUF3037 domain-containing protein [Aureimonas sp. D3]|uniref:DUF3037 domain-containing protein n=1 Tax=Aureimonas sp. D3 TaxID=1638164 RepID=UPI000784C5E8|nr:DUF3037 domain-containing protein [Aureimonas sp. D3]
MKYAYTYTLLRYRHDPLAGEAINVGVVLHSRKGDYLGVKVRKTVGRLTKVFPDVERSAVMEVLRSIERQIDRVATKRETSLFDLEANVVTFAKSALDDLDSAFLWSECRSGLTADPYSTLLKLYDRFVGRYDGDAKHTRDDLAVWQPLKDLLVERGIADRLQAKEIVSSVDRVSFDNAWKNGAWHCYQPLSLDLATADGIREKAARWSGHMTGLARSTETFRPYFFVGAPVDATLNEDYERAIKLLRVSACDPVVFEEHEIGSLADLIEDEMKAHDQSIAP